MYLRTKDYGRFIQSENLGQVISSDETLRLLSETAAQEEINSYLIGKYDTSKEFTSTDPFSITDIYSAQSRVELIGYPTYDPTATYTAASKVIVIYSGNIYQCKSDSAVPAGNFTLSDWTLLGALNDLFYIALPYPAFNINEIIKKGYFRFYKGKIYKALRDSYPVGHDQLINYVNYSGVPAYNVFPDDPVNGQLYWGTGTTYAVTGLPVSATASDYVTYDELDVYAAGDRVNYNGLIYESLINTNVGHIPGDDITSWQSEAWIKGDNRSQQMVMAMIDITLYHLHSRIAPNNIPDLRVKRYDDIRKWLKSSNVGDITPNLQLKQPTQGNRIAYGGSPKVNNIY